MSGGAYDRRGCSIAVDVDDAIERIVNDFESRDVALRLDVLRALSAQARLALETAQVQERLCQHPVAMDLIKGVTSQSLVYKTLAETVTVESCSCDYDVKRNVVMATSVCWTLPSSGATGKKRKQLAGARARDERKKMYTKYRFERTRRQEKKEGDDGMEVSLVKFSVVVAFGDDDLSPRELLYFELACEHPYPRSYYEDQRRSVLSGEEREQEEEEGDDKESGKEEGDDKESGKEEKPHAEKKSGEEEADTAAGDDETFGEEQREFRFDNDVLADMAEWMQSGKKELDPVDVVGFFMALPVHEDEWLIDERVCAILFQGGTEGDGSDESGSETEEGKGVDAAERMGL
uniref:Nucleosome assembly protein n=1 Tax=Peronospora matthiolae TaxID=2874970 RepID=A0AAV1U9H1_9STRA